MNELQEYIIALTNLYGIVSQKKVVEIYNLHHDEPVSFDDVHAMYKNPPIALAKAFVFPEQGFFVQEVILEFDEFEETLEMKGDKPFYIPPREELLRYVDEEYFERTPQYDALLAYLSEFYFPDDADLAEELLYELRVLTGEGPGPDTIVDTLLKWNFSFDDLTEDKEFILLIMDYTNNVRLWVNNGHTLKELYDRFERPLLRPLPKEPFAGNRTNIIDMNTRKQIGRNAPCPCGSGKKFKHCCLKETKE